MIENHANSLVITIVGGLMVLIIAWAYKTIPKILKKKLKIFRIRKLNELLQETPVFLELQKEIEVLKKDKESEFDADDPIGVEESKEIIKSINDIIKNSGKDANTKNTTKE